MPATVIDGSIYDQGMLALRSTIEDIRIKKRGLPDVVIAKPDTSKQRSNVILIVEDNPGDVILLTEAIKERFPDYNIISCDTVREAFQELARGVQWMIVDWYLPDGSPLLLLGAATEAGVKVCVWSGGMALSRLGISVFSKEERDSVVDWLEKIRRSNKNSDFIFNMS